MSVSIPARRLAMLAAAALLAACASSSQSTSTSSAASQAGTQRRYTLTSVELQEAGTSNLFDALQKLRPEFLRQRGSQTIAAKPMPTSTRSLGGGAPADAPNPSTGTALPIASQPLRVYENETMLGGVEDLRRIDTKVVIEVRFVPGPEAGVRYGTNHSGGVIFVRTQ